MWAVVFSAGYFSNNSFVADIVMEVCILTSFSSVRFLFSLSQADKGDQRIKALVEKDMAKTRLQVMEAPEDQAAVKGSGVGGNGVGLGGSGDLLRGSGESGFTW